MVIPKWGIVHQFTNNTQETAHLLCTVIPSGQEAMFMEIGKPIAAGEFLPPPEMTEKTMKQMKAMAEKFGQAVYTPVFLTDTPIESGN